MGNYKDVPIFVKKVEKIFILASRTSLIIKQWALVQFKHWEHIHMMIKHQSCMTLINMIGWSLSQNVPDAFRPLHVSLLRRKRYMMQTITKNRYIIIEYIIYSTVWVKICFKVYSYQLTGCVSQFYLDQSRIKVLRIPDNLSPYGWSVPPHESPQKCPLWVAYRNSQCEWEGIQIQPGSVGRAGGQGAQQSKLPEWCLFKSSKIEWYEYQI